ncbi:MAG: hypothetical protein LBS43_00640 [Prevotellaceae bacterium]|nr:hypothetical protein [Prevotellaceae bacterium]
MKKLFVTVIAFFALTQVLFAQDIVFAQNDKVINASFGFGNTIYNGSGWKTAFPSVLLSGEYGIIDGLIDGKASIGAGVDLGYAGMKYNVNSSFHKYSSLILGARGSFHYQFIDKLDSYTGLLTGYNIVSGNSDYAISEFVWRCYVGVRYYLTNNFALMSEIDNVFLFSVGVAYKF